jgi:ribonuclease HI
MDLVVYCDGSNIKYQGSRRSVGAWIITDSNWEIVSIGTIDTVGKDQTNNIAEYHGLLGALLDLESRGLSSNPIQIYTDSKLVVEQVNNRWALYAPHLRVLRDKCWILLEKFDNITIEWVPRALNWSADAISNCLY